MAGVDTEDGDARLTLRDGRTLAYHEWGVPDGVPVLRLQGTPGSRFSRYPKPEVWQRLGVRMIMADRPGYAEVRYHALGSDPKKDTIVRQRTNDASKFVTGSELVVDGGATAQ